MTECCPWKGQLSELNRHLKACPFDEKRISVNIKKQFTNTLSGDVKNTYCDDNTGTGDYLDYNPKNASLKARLYQKNPELMGKVLNEEENGHKTPDIYALIGFESRHIPENNLKEIKNNKISEGRHNNINANFQIDDSEEHDQSDINFILPYKYENEPNSNYFLRNKRPKRTGIRNNLIEKEYKNNLNDANSDTNSFENMNESEKKELEDVLKLSMRDKVENNDMIVEDN